jgi:ribosomal-protein-alanine N-acetyltransferase
VPPFHLRDFRKDDFERIWRLDQLCFPRGIAYTQPELAYYLTRGNAFTVVAEDGGDPPQLVGFIVAQRLRPSKARAPAAAVGHIITIDVASSARRSGLGTELLRVAEQRLTQLGCDRVTLETAVDNAAAIAFYERHDYSVVRTIPRYYHGELDALRMEKQLVALRS